MITLYKLCDTYLFCYRIIEYFVNNINYLVS